MFVCRGGATPERNLIIAEALNNIPPRRQAVIIIYINGEGRVIIYNNFIRRIFIHRLSQHQGEDLSSPIGEEHNESVDDVVITTRKRKKMCW